MSFLSIFVLYIICEVFELFYIHKGDTIGSYIANLLLLYKRGILRFLCLHPTFYIAIFTAIYLDTYNVLAMTLIAFKALDMVTKLILLQKIENKEPLGAFANIIERNVDIPFFIKVTASLLYIGLFHAAFGPALDNLHHMV